MKESIHTKAQGKKYGSRYFKEGGVFNLSDSRSSLKEKH